MKPFPVHLMKSIYASDCSTFDVIMLSRSGTCGDHGSKPHLAQSTCGTAGDVILLWRSGLIPRKVSFTIAFGLGFNINSTHAPWPAHTTTRHSSNNSVAGGSYDTSTNGD